MTFLMLVNLYTSRVVLNALGVEDYGIFIVIGGFVMMFSILSSSLSTSVSRFLTFELGNKNTDRLNIVFSTSLTVQVFMAILVMIVAEIVGVWFLNNKMEIPTWRLPAANWVLQCSIITFAVNLIMVPFNASIIAHERMSAFAYLSIVEGLLKLFVAFVVKMTVFDKLETYSILLLLVAFLTCFSYGVYCRLKFSECKLILRYEKHILKTMTSFAGWSFLGNGAFLFNTQGINILMNLFFGVTLNAARGIATQVENVIMQFVNNFIMAVNPQITKSYAEGNMEYMHILVCRGAKYSCFLLLFFALPICLETEQVLTFWLKSYPPFTVTFVRLTFLTSIFTVVGNTLITAQLATGRIKRYQIVITICGLWVFPLTWLAYYWGGSPVWAYVIYSCVYFILIFVRIYLVRGYILLSWKRYISEVLLKCLYVIMSSLLLPIVVVIFCVPSIYRTICVFMLSIISLILCIYLFGLEKKERIVLINQLSNKLNH